MAAKVNDQVLAFCEHCQTNVDATVTQVSSNTPQEIECSKCQNKQPYQAPKAMKPITRGRRVVDFGDALASQPISRGRRKNTRGKLARPSRQAVHTALPGGDDMDYASKTPEAPPPSRLEQRWDNLTKGVVSRDGRPYRKSDSYMAGEILLHTVYGMGMIEEVDKTGTLKVLFRRGYENLPSQEGLQN